MGLRDRLKQTAKSLLGQKPPQPEPARAAPPGGGTGKPPATLPTAKSADGYRAVAFSRQVTDGKAGTFPLEGYGVVAVFRLGPKLFCIDNACAHEDGPVGEGAIEGTCVRCPYHDWEYDFTTGACRTDPTRALASFAVREADGVIWVGPKLTEGTKARGGDHNDGMETIIR